MENLRRINKLALLFCIMAFAVLFGISCSENPLVSTGSQATQSGQIDTTTTSGQADTTSIPMDTSQPQTAKVLQRSEDYYDSNPLMDLVTSTVRVVTRLLGGTVSLLDVSLEIPPLALDRNTQISIDIPDPSLYVYDFGPDGLKFSRSAIITISYDYADLTAVNESSIRLAWWDDSAQKWVNMPCTVDPIANTVVGPIDHFSSYGLISD